MIILCPPTLTNNNLSRLPTRLLYIELTTYICYNVYLFSDKESRRRNEEISLESRLHPDSTLYVLLKARTSQEKKNAKLKEIKGPTSRLTT